jgi:tetratricopeptide (TPR) repeat protein
VRLLILLLALGGVAQAQEDPDTEIARRHFRKGSEFYSANDYAAALKEFEAARRAFASPAIDYNIARCHDRLENYPLAIEYYERYLATAKDAPDAGEIARRIQALKQRVAEEKPAPAPAPAPVVAPAPVAVAQPAHSSKKRTWAIVGGVL